ncbi:MAG: peptidoglycan bridge formation glycyltransferase FemA/FemB family protein [Oligoflexia bacterium]|nr:peptidoglycan bridge formation glycyltransferase FemA/FemB family protein [Oligoflexia bacterium]
MFTICILNDDTVNLDDHGVLSESGIAQTNYWKNISREKGEIPLVFCITQNSTGEKSYLLGIEKKTSFLNKLTIIDGLNFYKEDPHLIEHFCTSLLLFIKNKYDSIYLQLAIQSKLNNSPSLKNLFSKHSFTHRFWQTSLLDLNLDLNQINANFTQTYRRYLKRKDSFGTTCHKIPPEKILENYYLPYHKLEKQNGRHWKLEKKIIEKHLEFDHKQRYHHYILFNKENPCLATLGFYIIDEIATEICSSSSIDCFTKNIPAQLLLHWEAIKEAKILGARYFNLAGINPNPQCKKEQGIKFFKEKFGGEIVNYDIFEKKSLKYKLVSTIFTAIKKIAMAIPFLHCSREQE